MLMILLFLFAQTDTRKIALKIFAGIASLSIVLLLVSPNIKALLFSSKSKVFQRIQRVIPISKRRELACFSFQKGHKNKIFYQFNYVDFNEIKRVW